MLLLLFSTTAPPGDMVACLLLNYGPLGDTGPCVCVCVHWSNKAIASRLWPVCDYGSRCKKFTRFMHLCVYWWRMMATPWVLWILEKKLLNCHWQDLKKHTLRWFWNRIIRKQLAPINKPLCPGSHYSELTVQNALVRPFVHRIRTPFSIEYKPSFADVRNFRFFHPSLSSGRIVMICFALHIWTMMIRVIRN